MIKIEQFIKEGVDAEYYASDIDGDIPFELFERVLSGVIKKILPKFYFKIWKSYGFMKTYGIAIAPENKKSGAVTTPQKISFSYRNGVLKTQIYGLDGGGHLLLNPDEGSHSYLKYLSVKLSKFNCRKGTESITNDGERWDAQVKKLEKRFTIYMKRYLKLLKENKDNLKYQDEIDYDKYF